MRNNEVYAAYCTYNRIADKWCKANEEKRQEYDRITDKLLVIMDAWDGGGK